jgi:signal transduction histidine kinase
VLVTLAWEQRKLQLVVCDDGRGFDGADSLGQSGLGIKNLQRRASALDGNLSIESKPGAGTSVRLDVPLPRKRKSR